MRVLGVDPGPNTGFFIFGHGLKYREQVPGLREMGDRTKVLLQLFTPEVVVYEDFNVKDPRASNGPATHDTLDAIGALKYVCLGAKYDLTVVRRWNSDKRKVTDDMLEERDWLTRPKKEWRHANDAARHVLSWSLKEGVDLT